jgi:Rad3-related DNA helicase
LNEHPLRFFTKHSIVPREQQKRVVDAIHQNWDNYDYFALSLPTGVGKTFIATSIADSVEKAYILTSTLQLQNQYERSWTELVNLKGRGNYTCQLNTNFTVDAAPCSAQPDLIKLCKRDKLCSYYNQKDLAIKSQSMITNPVYMLYSTHCGFASDEDTPWVRRSVLIIDEAHNLENHLVQFAESDVDPEALEKDFGINGAKYNFTGNPEHDYMLVVDLQQALMEKAEELAEKIEKEFPARKFIDDSEIKSWARGMTEKVAERVRKLNAKAYQLDKAIQPLKIFFNTHSTPEELSRRWLISKYPDKNVLKLAPIYGDFLFTEYFGTLADKFVFLSATLGSKNAFCKEIGVEEKECFFIETDSPFPADKSPVIVMPSIKLSKGFYEENVKKVGTLVDEILNLHPNERGIIHCVEGSMLINTSDGLKMISDVKVGDKVQSWNEIELKFENKQVTHTYDNGERECIELMLSDGRTLICTPDHKILTDRGYVEAKDLTEEDEIIDEFAEDRRVR